MAFTAEAIARLKLDTTDFQRGLTKTSADVGKVGEDINRKLKRAFGAGDFFKGILQGLGIGSVEHLVGKLTEGWKEAADHAKDIAESTAKTLGIYEQIFSSRRTDQQNLDANLREQATQQKKLAAANTQTFEDVTFPGDLGDKTVRMVKKAKDAKAAQQASERLAELAKEEFEWREKLKNTVKKTADDTTKMLAAEKKARDDLAAFEAETARSQLTTKGQLEDAEQRLFDLKDHAVQNYSEDIGLSTEIAKLERERLALQKKLTDETEKEKKARDAIVERIDEAKAALAKTKSDAATAERDRSGWTVGDLASAGRGSGVNQTQKAQAREVMRLESRAKRDRAGGFENSASMRMQWAKTIRENMDSLTSDEKNPMADAAEAITKSEAHLEKIKEELAETALQ